jgi:hypothetical protein
VFDRFSGAVFDPKKAQDATRIQSQS